MLFSVEQAFVGRDQKQAPLKAPAWEAIAIPVVGSFVLRYSPEAASLWTGSCGVQLSVVVYDKTVDRKRQFIEHSYCFG